MRESAVNVSLIQHCFINHDWLIENNLFIWVTSFLIGNTGVIIDENFHKGAYFMTVFPTVTNGDYMLNYYCKIAFLSHLQLF